MNRIQFSPSIWGSPAWKFLHTVALSYPAKPSQKDKSDYKQFFLSLENVLPCETCAGHFKDNIKVHNIDNYLDGPHDLFSWTVKIRNEVQKILGRQEHNEEQLRESLYVQNEKAGGFLDIDPKFKMILWFVLIIGSLYTITRFFKFKITPKE